MSMNPQFKTNLKQVATITLFYVMINWFLVFYTISLLQSDWSLGMIQEFTLSTYFIANTAVGLIAGICGGTALVYVNSKLFRRKSFGYAMSFTLLSYTAIYVLIVFVIPIVILFLERQLHAERIIEEYAQADIGILLANFFLWMVITMSTLFFLQINDKFGPGILRKFLLGQYHHPKEENRIFMFMDMKSSTSIAEQIGSTKYFQLLQDVFTDMTSAITSSGGEIYQYVGDEVIVSWKLKEYAGNKEFLHCFDAVQKRFSDLSEHYRKKFGVVPEFKAGVHHGQVTAGEIGIIKKDIVYSGDVLNTASRIQGQCNEYGVKLLMSEATAELLPEDNERPIAVLGDIELRGKHEVIKLVSLMN